MPETLSGHKERCWQAPGHPWAPLGVGGQCRVCGEGVPEFGLADRNVLDKCECLWAVCLGQPSCADLCSGGGHPLDLSDATLLAAVPRGPPSQNTHPPSPLHGPLATGRPRRGLLLKREAGALPKGKQEAAWQRKGGTSDGVDRSRQILISTCCRCQ